MPMARAREPRQDTETRSGLGHETPESTSPPTTDARPKRLYVFASPEEDAREGIPGTVVTNRVRCGKPGCRCARGDPHGPYFYRYWYEGGRRCKAYVRQEEVTEVAAGIARWRELHPPLWSTRQELAERNRLGKEVGE